MEKKDDGSCMCGLGIFLVIIGFIFFWPLFFIGAIFLFIGICVFCMESKKPAPTQPTAPAPQNVPQPYPNYGTYPQQPYGAPPQQPYVAPPQQMRNEVPLTPKEIKAIPKFCSHCGAKVTSKFCTECGTPFE